jgi:peroxiredoxin
VTPFTLTSLSGRSVSVPAGRPGVLFFSVSACSSCIPSARALSSLKSQLGERIDALMVDIDPGDSPQDLRAWGRAVGHLSYPLAIDATGQLALAYQVQELGTTVIYDAQGRIVSRSVDPGISALKQGLRRAGISV